MENKRSNEKRKEGQSERVLRKVRLSIKRKRSEDIVMEQDSVEGKSVKSVIRKVPVTLERMEVEDISDSEESESEGSESEGSVCLYGVYKPRRLTERGLKEEMDKREGIKYNLVLKGDERVYKVFHLYNLMKPLLGEKVYIEMESREKRIYKVKDERDRQLILGCNTKLKEVHGIEWERELTERQRAIRTWVKAEARYLTKKGSKVTRIKGYGMMVDERWKEWDEKEGELIEKGRQSRQ